MGGLKMLKSKILNKKEITRLFKIINKQWGCDCQEEFSDYAFLLSEKNKVYIVNREIFDLDLSKLRVNSMGVYLGELKRDALRLSIEGSQLIGPKSTKNVVELDKKELREWLKGNNIELKNKDIETGAFVIIKSKDKDDFLGTGRYSQEKIFNFVPKVRRLRSAD